MAAGRLHNPSVAVSLAFRVGTIAVAVHVYEGFFLSVRIKLTRMNGVFPLDVGGIMTTYGSKAAGVPTITGDFSMEKV